MELLNSTRRRTLRRLALLGLLLSICGCALLESLGLRTRELVFSHALHVGEEGLSCVSCHEGMAVAEEPGMPALDTCLSCHELWEEEVAEERRVQTLFDADGSYRAARVAHLGEEPVFEHLRHVQAGIDCADCHAEIASAKTLGEAQAVSMAACESCHRERDVPHACSTCHSTVDRDWAPPSHAQAWERFHGQVARRGSPLTADACNLCHEESTCADCHETLPPEDHSQHFRLRGHGLLASMDRARCAACHEASTCEQCHAESRPLSHRGRFGGSRSDHCLGCHLPLRSIECSACHLGTPSHDLAPPKPGWHTPAMDCRQCHGRGQPLLHADNGTNCNLCHL